jgi:hypothetical protein
VATAYGRSERAREKPEDDAFIQHERVIVDALREHVRSYSQPWPVSDA